MSKWIPDRKVWAGGLIMVIAWLIIQALNRYARADIPAGAEIVLAIGIGKVVEWFVPQPAKELIAKIDNEIVAAAGRSPSSDVSKEVGAAAQQVVVKEMLTPAAVVLGNAAESDFDAMMARISGKG